jgi:hypothetical protein
MEHGFLPCGLAACYDEATGNTPRTTTVDLGGQIIVISILLLKIFSSTEQ